MILSNLNELIIKWFVKVEKSIWKGPYQLLNIVFYKTKYIWEKVWQIQYLNKNSNITIVVTITVSAFGNYGENIYKV